MDGVGSRVNQGGQSLMAAYATKNSRTNSHFASAFTSFLIQNIALERELY